MGLTMFQSILVKTLSYLFEISLIAGLQNSGKAYTLRFFISSAIYSYKGMRFFIDQFNHIISKGDPLNAL